MIKKIKTIIRSRNNDKVVSRLKQPVKRIYDEVRRNPRSLGFDPIFYLSRYPDVEADGLDPFLHYLLHGAAEGREMRPGFSLRWLAEMNDLNAAAPYDILTHIIKSDTSESKKRAAFFGYAWNGTWRLDVYMREIVLAIARLGIDVDVYIANQFTPTGANTGFRADITKAGWQEFLKSRGYNFAISFNNALVSHETVHALDCTIVSVIVDSVGHLFNHSNGEWIEPFRLPVHVAPIYCSLVDDLKSDVRTEADVSFIPAATAVSRATGNDRERSIDICWIASLVGDHNLDRFMGGLQAAPYLQRMVRKCLTAIASGHGIQDDPATIEAAEGLCAYANWDLAYLEMQLQNVITNADRLAVVEKLAPLGLTLFGNKRWRSLFSFSPALLQSYADASHIQQHRDLCLLYDRSKISINIPQAQAATGMQYRIYDILASRSLLITKYIENSDMEYVFGKDSPIVTFNNLEELHDKCQYYLINEAARQEQVARCNALVSQGFSFSERTIQYLKLSGDLGEDYGASLGKGFCNLMSAEQVVDYCSKHETLTKAG